MKTRCPIIFGFHPGAQNCSVAAAKIVRDAAIEAGAPENCIQWIEHPSIEATGALMKHDGVATILATGGPGMVKAAYSSGKPALGVGAGNAPAYVDKNVDVVRAANDLILSKHFDYGMICATEQAIIADKDIYDPLVKELKRRKAYFVNDEEKAKLEQYMFGCTAYSGQTPKLNSVVPGKSPQYIAKAAGFEIPEDRKFIAVTGGGINEIGKEFFFSSEKLTTLLALFKYEGEFENAITMMQKVFNVGGKGHSCGIYSWDEDHIHRLAMVAPVSRMMVRQPNNRGNSGSAWNGMPPTSSMGCGTWGGNIVSENISLKHYMNTTWVSHPLPYDMPSNEELFGEFAVEGMDEE